MSDSLRYFVIVPAYNEGKIIESVLKRLTRITRHLIVVDDGSTDGTSSVAQRFTRHVLTHSINMGKGAALKTGCEYAFKNLKADGVVFIDSDGQHDPKEIKQFIKQLAHGHDLVFGVRTLDKRMPRLRVWANKALSHCINLMFGAYIPDILSGYKAMSKKGYGKVRWSSQGYDVETEIAVRTALYQLDYALIPISTIYNKFDRGMTFADALRLLPRIIEWRLRI